MLNTVIGSDFESEPQAVNAKFGPLPASLPPRSLGQ